MVDCLQMLLGKSISNYYENNVILIERNPFIVLEVEVRGETIFLGRLFTSTPGHVLPFVLIIVSAFLPRKLLTMLMHH